ncbi:hypothetical protein CDL12_07598 [Handroanthus impetiginosus]|uniref:Uncharacterized protein n=1 Tax=Handroanthus impetiginosus TaxID=429701 RepID=A0A2G9HQB7_9LAMI|nr:hypothetical protein CDL12_07598 [Handroanthus impetiginosus]
MKLLCIRSKSSAHCFVSANINGSSNGVSGIGSVLTPLPPQLGCRLRPLKSSVNNVKLSFPNHSFYDRKTSISRFPHLLPSALAKTGPPSSNQSSDEKLAVVAWSAITFVLAVGNRVLQKLALVPMKDYPLFFAQLGSFVYAAIYFSMLHVRYHAGITTDEMLAVPKSPLIAIGFLESVAVISAMYAGAMLPGPAIAIIYQTYLIWQLVFSSLFLGRRYSLNQILGCFLVAAGVVVAVTSGSNNNRMLSGVGLFWPALMLASSVFQAAASIVKESVFVDAATRLKVKMNNMCRCDGAPLLPLLYMISNLFFSISILNLLKSSNAIVTSLAVRSSVPFAIYVLSLPLPCLPKGVSLSPLFHLGNVILVVGLILYNMPWPWNQQSEIL